MKRNTCERCNKQFLLHIEQDGKMVNLYNRKYCLACSPRGGFKEQDGKKVCPNCQENKDSHLFHRSKNGLLKSWCNPCVSQHGVKAQQNRKLRAIEYKGGKCVRCGYSKCKDSLQFHHIDPKKKEFRIAQRKGLSWDRIKPELDKCELVCANCHGEIHAKT